MRVLLVSDAYPPMIGGATRAAQQLARQLAARGHAVEVATSWQRRLPADERDGPVRVRRLRGLVSRIPAFSSDPVRYTPPPFPDPELVWRFRGVLREFRPELVHAYGWLTYSCAAAALGSDVPFLLAAREYANICAVRTLVRDGERCAGPGLAKCLGCAGRFYGAPKGAVAVAGVLGGRTLLRHKLTGLHSTSHYTQRMLHRYLIEPDGKPDEVIPDFREDELVGAPDPSILARLPKELYILFVGSFRRIKGDEVLLAAYERLDDPPPLVLIGARSAEPLPSFPPGVTALLDVPHDTVMAAWDGALFGVAPSIVPEALGNVVHEAMSRGKPVIGTRPGGHEDMIVDGESGLLVPGGNVEELAGAMRRLLADGPLRERMAEAARARAQSFTVEAVLPQFEAFYRATLGPTGQDPKAST